MLVSKVDEANTRAWYLEQAVAHGWSRAVLTVQIESGLHLRQGKALTNFDRTPPPDRSDLAQQTVEEIEAEIGGAPQHAEAEGAADAAKPRAKAGPKAKRGSR